MRLERIERATRRRAGVFRRAIRREVSRLRDPHRVAAIVVLGLVGGVLAAGLWARGDAAGADARAYWAGVRIWLDGGDPYHPVGPFMPYVYAPWLLPLFTPWALLPWEIAWFVWRGASILMLLWTIHWAYRRRPIWTDRGADRPRVPDRREPRHRQRHPDPRVHALGRPVRRARGWRACSGRSRRGRSGCPAPFWLILAPRGRLWGLLWLGVAILLSLATLPLTIVQLETLFGFGSRPIRLDYLVLLWAAVPWLWRHPDPLWWLHPREWPSLGERGARVLGRSREALGGWAATLRARPEVAAATARREVGQPRARLPRASAGQAAELIARRPMDGRATSQLAAEWPADDPDRRRRRERPAAAAAGPRDGRLPGGRGVRRHHAPGSRSSAACRT